METSQQFDEETTGKLERCESILGYRFSDRSLLLEALTHASGASHRLQSNERLEFLGDSILGFLVCTQLFDRFPDWSEGELTRIKSAAVSRSTCAKIGHRLGLEEVLIVGKGMDAVRTVPRSLLSNVIESIIGAIFLDGGIDAVRQFILPLVEEQLEPILAGTTAHNYKSDLQHLVQRRFGEAPQYVLVDQQGPDHKKRFLISAIVGRRRFSPAWGDSKKQAEQRAACNALAELDEQDAPFPAAEVDTRPGG